MRERLVLGTVEKANILIYIPRFLRSPSARVAVSVRPLINFSVLFSTN